MGGGTLLFNTSHGIRFRAHPTCPLRIRTVHSSCCTYRRDAVQRCLAIKSEANEEAQSRRNAKSNSVLTPKSISKTTSDEANSQREHLNSLLKKIDESIKKSASVAEPKEISTAEQKQQALSPKFKGKKLMHGQMKSTGPPSKFEKLSRDDDSKAVAPVNDAKKSSGYESTFAILRADDGKKVTSRKRFDKKFSGPSSNFDKSMRDNGDNATTLPRFDVKSSGPPSNFDKLIKDNTGNAVALPPNYKPPRPTSKFVRRSPIPTSSSVKEEVNITPKKDTPSITREPFKKEMSLSDKLQAIMERQIPPKPELRRDIREILNMKTSPKFGGIPKALTELKAKLNLQESTIPELRDIPKTEPGLVSHSELETMTVAELKNIARARKIKGYSRCKKKAELLEMLKGTSPDS